MKLELKHLAGYLPYELKGIADDKKNIDTLLGIYGTGGHTLTLCCKVNNHNTVDYDCNIDDFKPILRPLSDLIKEVEVNGEKFVPIDKINENGEYGLLIGSLEKICLDNLFWEDKCEMNMLNIFEINKLNNLLYEWHFDIYELIENGLAIDINTLYK